jgi:hypothetical protein
MAVHRALGMARELRRIEPSALRMRFDDVCYRSIGEAALLNMIAAADRPEYRTFGDVRRA